MSVKGFKSHPYIPNSVPEVEQEMLHEIGLNSLEELHEDADEKNRTGIRIDAAPGRQ